MGKKKRTEHTGEESDAARLLQSLRKKKTGGKSGGRPATIQHQEDERCRCAECRKKRGWSPYAKETAVSGRTEGAFSPLAISREESLNRHPVRHYGKLDIDAVIDALETDYSGMTEAEEIKFRLREYMGKDPEADEGVMRGQVARIVREERRKRDAPETFGAGDRQLPGTAAGTLETGGVTHATDAPPNPQFFGKSEQLNSTAPGLEIPAKEKEEDVPIARRVSSLLGIPGLKRGSDL